jgi:hypothetical protein
MGAIHLLLTLISMLVEGVVVVLLVGRYPINRAIRWKKK